MTRPVDWSPLAGSDPVRGNAHTVTQEGKYYSDVADQISDQVERLRRIASQDEMLGKTADKLRESAGDLAEKLEKTHGRFATVGSALTAWVPYLETAQRDTLQAYNDAQDAVADQRRYAKPPAAPADPSAPPPTEAQKTAAAQADTTRQNNLDAANGALTAAKKKFDDALTDRDSHAKVFADRIRDSLHDGLKDGFWDHISHWVTQHLKMIKMIVQVLSWIATIVAIACIFIPGLDLIALALTAMVLLGHTLLAATGNGSWFDVALDVFAIATLGAGKLLADGAEASRGLALARGADIEGSAARTTVVTARAGEKTLLQNATSNIFKRLLTPSGWQAARALKGFDDVTETLASTAENTARSGVLTRALPSVNAAEKLAAGNPEIAANMKDLAALKTLYAGDTGFDAAAKSWNLANQFGRGGIAAAQTADLTDKIIGDSDLPLLDHKPYSHGYVNFKETAGEFIGHTLHLPGGE